MRRGIPHFTCKAGHICDEHTTVFPGAIHQDQIEFLDLVDERRRNTSPEMAENAVIDLNKIQLDYFRLAMRSDGFPPRLQLGENLISEARARARLGGRTPDPPFFSP